MRIEEFDVLIDRADLLLDHRQIRLLKGLRWLIQRESREIMAGLDTLTAAQEATITGLADLGAQTVKLAAQIAALQAGIVTQAQIDAAATVATAIAEAVTAAGAAVDAAYEAPGEDDVVTPPEEPPVV